jgi:hypothetical protein
LSGGGCLRCTLAALALAALLAGCGGGGSSNSPQVASDGTVKISAGDFAAWQSAAKAATGIDCATPVFVFPDTGEAIKSEGDEDKVDSKQRPAFQCQQGLPFFFATQAASEEKAKKLASDTAGVREADGNGPVDPPTGAPAGTSCIASTKPKRYTCATAWRNLRLLATSTESLKQAGADLTGGLELVKSVYGAN